MENTTVREALANVFGREWLALMESDKDLIVRDCVEAGGVTDYAKYRRDIGTGNLEAYATVMRARFNRGVVTCADCGAHHAPRKLPSHECKEQRAANRKARKGAR